MNKRKIPFIFLCLGVVLLFIGLVVLGVSMLAVSDSGIIGGADEPTVTFVFFHQYGGFCFWSMFAGLISVIIAAVLRFCFFMRKPS